MAPEKKILTEKEKSLLIDLILNNCPRTLIAERLNIRNTTLERICKDNNIKLPKKYCSAFLRKENIEGCIKINCSYMYFENLSNLYCLLAFSKKEGILYITRYDENSYKITCSNNSIKIIQIDKDKKATNEMIKNAVNQRKIKFMNSYLNKKWGINYEL